MTFNRPKVSILSPVHNEAKLLGEMISSVQAQSLQEWELLFVDDGSVDKTESLIQQAAQDDPRVKLISGGQKVGKVRAFNLAYEHSTGQVIVLLAGDDRVPRNSLSLRYGSVAQFDAAAPSVGFFKIRTFSDDPKYDGMVLPRKGASRSGGSITMNRALSDLLFPIDETLVSEDIWLSHAATDLATNTIQTEDIALEYRIHPGNSNPRAQSFDRMNASIHARHRAWQALLDCDRLDLSAEIREELRQLWRAEELRYQGRVVPILQTSLPLVERLAIASGASPILFVLRSKCYKAFSGHRRR